jgi:hypothetical protein
MKDAASIAAKFLPLSEHTRSFDVYALQTRAARSIERYAARLVKAERERCINAVWCAFPHNTWCSATTLAAKAEKAINTPAKKRPSKRK